MNPIETPPDPKAFVRLASFQKVLAWFKAQTGITAPGNTVAQIAGGGKAVRFNNASGRKPFEAMATSGGIKIAAGFIGWAGRTLYFPEAIYRGTQPGGVFIRLAVDFIATVNADPADPWDIVIDEGDDKKPTLVWLSASDWSGGIGAHARIYDNDATSDEDIVTDEGVVYLPLATQFGSKIVQDFATAIDLYFLANGSVRISERPGN